jgi:hypothetical protein
VHRSIATPRQEIITEFEAAEKLREEVEVAALDEEDGEEEEEEEEEGAEGEEDEEVSKKGAAGKGAKKSKRKRDGSDDDDDDDDEEYVEEEEENDDDEDSDDEYVPEGRVGRSSRCAPAYLAALGRCTRLLICSPPHTSMHATAHAACGAASHAASLRSTSLAAARAPCAARLISTPPIHASFPRLLSTPPFHASYPRLLSTPPFHASYPRLLSTPPFHASFPRLLSTPPFHASFPRLLSCRPRKAPKRTEPLVGRELRKLQEALGDLTAGQLKKAIEGARVGPMCSTSHVCHLRPRCFPTACSPTATRAYAATLSLAPSTFGIVSRAALMMQVWQVRGLICWPRCMRSSVPQHAEVG